LLRIEPHPIRLNDDAPKTGQRVGLKNCLHAYPCCERLTDSRRSWPIQSPH
jgi:hypothetical protein